MIKNSHNFLTDDKDFSGLPLRVTLHACETSACVTTNVTDDETVENEETIEITASEEESRIVFLRQIAVITIIDNDSM